MADVRAATPTAAAQIAVPDTTELAEEIEELRRSMAKQLVNNAAYDRIKTDNLRDQIRQSMTGRINDLRNDIERMKMALEYNDPRKIMEKGYSIIRDENGRVVRDADSVEKGQILTADLEKGRLKVETVSKESDRK